jgi:hypothetical protein
VTQRLAKIIEAVSGSHHAGWPLPILRLLILLAIVQLQSACASTSAQPGPRPFTFGSDTLAYANELTWEYGYNPAGEWEGRQRQPAPDYALHCFVVARDSRQFFYHAHFDPTLPRTTTAAYIALVQRVLAQDPNTPSATAHRIVIPGYADLHEFSRYWEFLLKREGGGAWQSYLQRGNWRMVFPFSRQAQAQTAAGLLAETRHWHTPIVHVVTFPERTINHAVLIYRGSETNSGLQFRIYDPNDATRDAVLSFDRRTQTFIFPATQYFAGGPVDVYEVYRDFLY